MGCYNSKIVDAPVDKVWETIRDFHQLGWAKPVIETLEVVGDLKGDQLGAGRKLNGVFNETLRALDDRAKVIKYSIDQGPGPLEKTKGYVGEVRLLPVTDSGKTFVEWTSSWEHSEGGVKEFCDPIYVSLLGALGAHFEG